ncbi:Class II aaRS ABD-like protein [Pleurostoma richardsiae]|uniref:Class II aaRS ABD-like protein n=1 Tax=Pleurostoma richardsiae TaxID=41990 RepID=A0AA38RLG1_9PEZI|nr:Class II aaRS ABD-like protein [Pleurostoma richardsiae]
MGSRMEGSKGPLSIKMKNKMKRSSLYVTHKKVSGKERHTMRARRRKEEAQDPELKRRRLATNQPNSLDRKRVWDEGDDENDLYNAVDVAQLKRRRLEEEENATAEEEIPEEDAESDGEDVDSMLGSDDEDDEEGEEGEGDEGGRRNRAERDNSLAPSLAPSTTSTNLDLTPAKLAEKFPNLFSDDPPPLPKVLLTTSLHSTLHEEAQLLQSIFPGSEYIRRSAHRHSHNYSVREICKFASNRGYNVVLVLREDQKKPTGLTVVHLPSGPSLTYSISSWLEGKRIPGHARPQDYWPELLLNNFKTSLGLLSAASFFRLFPPQPDVAGRQVVTLHNQRDYIFFRRHRYVVREKRQTEKSVVDVEGNEIKGFEDVRVGLQEIGPRFTLKLRRVDKGIGRAGSQGEDALQWEWKPNMEKKRTRFNL